MFLLSTTEGEGIAGHSSISSTQEAQACPATQPGLGRLMLESHDEQNDVEHARLRILLARYLGDCDHVAENRQETAGQGRINCSS